jgi:hypothetical protein
VLDEARRHAGEHGPYGVTFADAVAEWLCFIEEDRERQPSTLLDYRSALNARRLPAFGTSRSSRSRPRRSTVAPLTCQPVESIQE